MILQNRYSVEDKILDKKSTEAYLRLVRESYELIDIDTPVQELYAPLQKLCNEFYYSITEENQKKLAPRSMAFYISMSAGYLQPWFRYFINYQPGEILKQATCPVLALNGDLDIQVTSKENLAGIKESLSNSQSPYFETRELKGLNHLFQKANTGDIAEYDQIEESFNPEVLEQMEKWIFRVFEGEQND